MASLDYILNLTLHLANVKTSHCKLFLEFTDSVNVQFEVELRASNGGPDLGKVS